MNRGNPTKKTVMKKGNAMDLQPVIPFEPKNIDSPPDGERWAAQVKWDGVRILTYYDGSVVRLFNRKRNERTLQFPELVDAGRYCRATSVILDGEMIAFREGKPSFHEVMKRDGIRIAQNVARAVELTPVTYMVFDVLFCDGRWVLDQPLSARQKLLQDIIAAQGDVQIVESFADGAGLFQVIQANGMEGIVCKDLNSRYVINGKDDRWLKVKNYRDLLAVVGGVTLRDGIVNAVLLGLYDAEGKLWYIGHAGTGKLSKAEWRELTERIRPLSIEHRPFVNKPDRVNGAVWIKPVLTLKVQYAEWPQGHMLRQPSIQAFVDVEPDACTFARI